MIIEVPPEQITMSDTELFKFLSAQPAPKLLAALNQLGITEKLISTAPDTQLEAGILDRATRIDCQQFLMLLSVKCAATRQNKSGEWADVGRRRLGPGAAA